LFKTNNPQVENVNIGTTYDPINPENSVINKVGDVYLYYVRHSNRFLTGCQASYLGIDESKCSSD
jgi:hypothetical protein